jgi:enoyl-CoA hydratase/carnithine racemase
MGDQDLLYRVENQVAWITLNRPGKLNALDRPLWKEARKAFQRADSANDVRVMVLTGSGRAFCAGDDIAELTAAQDPEIAKDLFLNCMYALVDTICRTEKPLIAAVNGLAYGGGCELVLISDMAIASDEAKFALPEARIGAWAPIFSVFGPSVVGHKAAHEMLMSTEPISARRAMELGLVNRVVPPDQVREATMELAAKIKVSAPTSLRITKETVNLDMVKHLSEFYIACKRFWHETSKTQNYMEGASAFLEKRPPQFKGR